MKARLALIALAACGVLRSEIEVYDAGRVLAPSSGQPQGGLAAATAGSFLAGTEGPGAASLNPGALAFSSYPYAMLSGVEPFNNSTQWAVADIGYSQPIYQGALSLNLHDAALGAYNLYDEDGAFLANYYGLQGGSEIYVGVSGAYRLSPKLGVGVGVGEGWVQLPGVGSFARPFDWSLGGVYKLGGRGSTALSLGLRQIPFSGEWNASTGSAALGVEHDLLPGSLRAALALQQAFATGTEGRAGLRWDLRGGTFSLLGGVLWRMQVRDQAERAFIPSAGLGVELGNLIGTLAFAMADGDSFQFTTELAWRFRPDAFGAIGQRGPDAARSYMDEARKELALEHLSGAFVLAAKAVEADPENPEALALRKNLEAQISEAGANSRKLKEYRAGAAFFSSQADACVRQGNLRCAVLNLERAIKVDEQNREIYEKLMAIKKQLDERLEGLKTRSSAAEKAGDLETAAKTCAEALALDDSQEWPQASLQRLSGPLAALRSKLFGKVIDSYVKASSEEGPKGITRSALLEEAIAAAKRSLLLAPTLPERKKLENALERCQSLKKMVGQ